MWLGVVRDIAIVLLALESIVIGIVLTLMLLQLRKLARMLREEIMPILGSASDTADTVQGTVHFVSHSVVSPLVEASSYVAGAKEAIRNLVHVGRKAKGRPPSGQHEI